MSQPFGILNVDKPAGWTSRDVVNVIAKLARPAKVGHAGTLDPLATGVLVVCVGPATRLVPYVQDQGKTYHATFQLGCRSNTDDIEGDVEDVPDVRAVIRSQVESLLPEFTGRIEQVPPQFSAVHVDGKRAYKLARQGEDVQLPARVVEVHRLELIRYQYPAVELRIECGSGTYVRAIGRDLGNRLGCGAVMSALRRTGIGPYLVEQAISLDELTQENWRSTLLPPAEAVRHLVRHLASASELEMLRNGRIISAEIVSVDAEEMPVAVLTRDGELAAIAKYRSADCTLAPKIVFPSDEDHGRS